MNAVICLGDKVKDRVTGLVGIVMAKTYWTNGCVRVLVQPLRVKEDKLAATETIDEPQLDVVKAGALKITVDLPEMVQIFRPTTVSKKSKAPTHGGRDDSAAMRRF